MPGKSSPVKLVQCKLTSAAGTTKWTAECSFYNKQFNIDGNGISQV